MTARVPGYVGEDKSAVPEDAGRWSGPRRQPKRGARGFVVRNMSAASDDQKSLKEGVQ